MAKLPADYYLSRWFGRAETWRQGSLALELLAGGGFLARAGRYGAALGRHQAGRRGRHLADLLLRAQESQERLKQ